MAVLHLCLLAAHLTAADSQTWPQWRGPARTGHTTGPDFPAQLTGLKQSWRVPLDKGYPGPIVATDRVFVAETANGDTEIVRALHRQTGRELWRASWKGKLSVPFFAKRNGDWIRSTPAWDGKTLYAGGMEEVLVALDGETGRELWRVDFPQRFDQPKPDFGFASSPLIDGDAIYVQAANSIVKLNKHTGATLWRSLHHSSGMMESGAFSSPLIATIAGRRQLVVGTRTTLAGLDLPNGAVLWQQEVPNYRGMNILTPVVEGDTVFTSLYRMDSFAFRIAYAGNRWQVSELWKNKTKGYMSTPVKIGNYLYMLTMNQRFTVLNWSTGESGWTTEPFGAYWSMAARNSRILALDEAGKLLLIEANPTKFQLLDSKEVTQSPAWAHLAVAGNEIFIRELNAITAYRWEATPSATATSE
ncbi:MAG: PQQ-like beta-propeller repeat protein [Bryobacterales bacterium]|nr:PQQ-like beta-propeller repeat protein [Bryobacterales bacterium]